jgi:hypothetical protein
MRLTVTRSFKAYLVLLWLVLCIAVSDIGLGILLKKQLLVEHDERNLTYGYDSELGWFPTANSRKTFTGGRTIQVAHNSRGFRDIEHVVGPKPRIVVLGDSFVWGYDVERPERFTEKLRASLPSWSVYNLGVSGFGTDQEYLLLKREYDFYKPQIVFLVFCRDNDEDDNTSNMRYGAFYKPYFTLGTTGLTLRGVPVPKSEKYFFAQHDLLARSSWVRLFALAYFHRTEPPRFVVPRSPTHAIVADMQRFVQSKGGQLVIGLQKPYPELEQFLEDRNIPHVDLTNPYVFATGSHHWTPEGHTLVSAKIKAFLDKGHFLRSSVNHQIVASPPCAISAAGAVRSVGCERKAQGRTSSN